MPGKIRVGSTDSVWFTTRSALFAGGDGVWDEVARYGEPLTAYIASRYARRWGLSPEDVADLVQEILIEMRERLVGSYDRSRGRFRALLQTVVRRRVIDHLRRARPTQPLDDALQLAPDEGALAAVDLEASLLEAVRACHDHFTQGPHRDLQVVWTLSDRLVHGLRNVDIVAREGLTPRQVERRLARARDVIFRHLLAQELGLDPGDGRLPGLILTFRRALRAPRRRARLLAEVAEEPLRDALGEFLERLPASLALFQGRDSARAQALRAGFALVLGRGADGSD